MQERYIKQAVDADLAERMVFVGGPRQVGKTTFALSLLGKNQDESSPAYQVHLGDRDFGNAETGTRVLPFRTFCKELALP